MDWFPTVIAYTVEFAEVAVLVSYSQDSCRRLYGHQRWRVTCPDILCGEPI